MSKDSSIVQTWATAISTNSTNGRKIIFRYAEALNPDFQKAHQSVRIIIVWKYNSEDGMPATEEHARMNEMEDAIEPVLSQDMATLALVSTGENLREWTYYARREEEFMWHLNFALLDKARFPIEIHIAHDPDWMMYQDFRNGIKD